METTPKFHLRAWLIHATEWKILIIISLLFAFLLFGFFRLVLREQHKMKKFWPVGVTQTWNAGLLVKWLYFHVIMYDEERNFYCLRIIQLRFYRSFYFRAQAWANKN